MVTRPTLAWLLILMTHASSALINKLFRPVDLAREQGGRGTKISTSEILSEMNFTIFPELCCNDTALLP